MMQYQQLKPTSCNCNMPYLQPCMQLKRTCSSRKRKENSYHSTTETCVEATLACCIHAGAKYKTPASQLSAVWCGVTPSLSIVQAPRGRTTPPSCCANSTTQHTF